MMARSITAEPELTTTAPGRPAVRPKRRRNNPWVGIIGWLLGILFFFPVLWMVITSFKTEAQAYTTTPHFVFTPTLVKRGPGPRTWLIGNLDHADLLVDLLDVSGVDRRRD